MNRLEEIKINKKGICKLKGKELKDFFPIGDAHCFSDNWDTSWKEEMKDEIPQNAKYFTCKIETYHLPPEGTTYEKAYVQFYGAKDKIENLPKRKKDVREQAKEKQIPNNESSNNLKYETNKVYVKRHGEWQWRETQHGYIDGDNTWD